MKRSLYGAACTISVPRLSRRVHRRKLLVVTYHGLREGPPPAGTSWSLLPVSQFERQVRYLRDHYEVLSIDDAVDALFSRRTSQPAACITFDDGYHSNYRLALPVLERYRTPATIYLATGFIGTDRLIWTIELDLAFQQTVRDTVDLRPLGLELQRLSDVASRARAARAVIAVLKPMRPATRAHALEHVRSELQLTRVEHDGAYSFMSWDEVSAMAASGLVSFGGHTVNHEIVANLDDQELRAEIETSIRTVRDRAGAVSNTFAYPNGGAADFDRRAAALLERAGCRAAVSTIEGLSDRGTDRYALRRFNIGSDMEFTEFRLLTSGALRRRARV